MVKFTNYAVIAAFSLGNVAAFAPSSFTSRNMPQTALKMAEDGEVIMNRYSRYVMD